MVVLAFVSLATSTGLYVSYNTKTDSILIRDSIQAYYIADAGVELALSNLKQDVSWRKKDPQFKEAFAGGTIETLKVITLSKTVDYEKVEITAKGVCRQATKTLVVTVQLEQEEGGKINIELISWKELYPVFV